MIFWQICSHSKDALKTVFKKDISHKLIALFVRNFLSKLYNLFDHQAAQRRQSQAPLADRRRPRTPDEYVGQEHIIAPGRLLRRAIALKFQFVEFDQL